MSVRRARPDPAVPPAEPAPPRGPHDAPVRVRAFARTDVGRTREHNEDAFLVADLAEAQPLDFDGAGARPAAFEARAGALFVVADGLGGAAAGEVASHMATEAAFRALRAALPTAAGDPTHFATALRDAVLAANATIHRAATERPDLRGMATTLTAAALRGAELYLAQVGDSRAYLVRGGTARQLTKDQSLVQRLVDAGELTPEQAETSARRNIILQALGAEASVKVDVTHQALRQGDVLLLCSDGLSGQVRAAELADAAAHAPDLDALCAALVDRANDTGGPDNITVVVARFDGPGLPDEPPAPADDAVGHRQFAVLPTPATTQAIVAEVLAGAGRPQRAADASSGDLASPGAPPAADDPAAARAAAERRDRARLVYLVLAVLAASVAAFYLYRLLVR